MRPTSVYRCQACGFQAGKWYGRCPDCGEFNTIVEERTESARPSGGGRRRDGAAGPAPVATAVRLAAVSAAGAARVQSGVAELDRVLGGGVVPGSLVLIGGDPGIGKSTLLLQASAALAARGGPGPLRVGRGVGGPGQAPGGPARARPRRTSSSSPRRSSRRSRRTWTAIKPRAAGRRLDPDGVPRRSRVGAREREPGARVRRAAHGPGEEPGDRGLPGGPRHQGGRARRAARARAPGRHRPLLRGRAARDVPRPPGRQEPVRLDQRDRRLRDDRAGARARSRIRRRCSWPSGRAGRRAR